MEETDTLMHTFIVRIWLEEAADAGRPARWRGHVTHLPSRQRVTIESLDDLRQFVTPYLEAMGATPL